MYMIYMEYVWYIYVIVILFESKYIYIYKAKIGNAELESYV